MVVVVVVVKDFSVPQFQKQIENLGFKGLPRLLTFGKTFTGVISRHQAMWTRLSTLAPVLVQRTLTSGAVPPVETNVAVGNSAF